MGQIFYFEWELAMLQWLQTRLSPMLLSIVSQFSLFGETLFLILLLGWIYWCRDKSLGRRVGWCLVLGSAWGLMLKDVVQRLRPYLVSDELHLLRKIDSDAAAENITAQGFSFPSVHSFEAVAAYGTLGRALRKRWMTALAIALPLLVGFSRVAVGAHFPTDVLVGWALGLAVVFLVPYLRQLIRNPWTFRILAVLSAVPGLFFCVGSDFYSAFGLLVGFALAEAFEQRCVRFAPAKGFWRSLLRLVGGVSLYLALNALLKLPFSAEFLSTAAPLPYAIRAARYAIVSFATLGLYPMLFPKETK